MCLEPRVVHTTASFSRVFLLRELLSPQGYLSDVKHGDITRESLWKVDKFVHRMTAPYVATRTSNGSGSSSLTNNILPLLLHEVLHDIPMGIHSEGRALLPLNKGNTSPE